MSRDRFQTTVTMYPACHRVSDKILIWLFYTMAVCIPLIWCGWNLTRKLPLIKIYGPMDVILYDRKNYDNSHVILEQTVTDMIESIDAKIGIAPNQTALQTYLAQQCLELGLDQGNERPRKAFYNSKHKLLYVSSPKCASTSFKKFLLRLGGDERDYDEMKNVHNLTLNPLLKSLWDEPTEFQTEVLRTYYKFTFVRNPLVRLVSGYRNKIVRVPKDNYVNIIKSIISEHYSSDAAEKWQRKDKYRPSFEQFVEYLLRGDHAYRNYHWAPYADTIKLCGSFKYDLIGQLETAQQHIDEMKRNVPSLRGVPFPYSRKEGSIDSYSSEELTPLAFLNLTDALRIGVYQLYENEIKLLGYAVIGEENFPFTNLTNVSNVTYSVSDPDQYTDTDS